jgi:hypothetical protein
MAFANRNQVVEALAPSRAHPALRDRVGPRRPNRSAQAGDAESGAAQAEVGAPDAMRSWIR